MYERGFIPVSMKTKVKAQVRYFTVYHNKTLCNFLSHATKSSEVKTATDLEHYDALITSVSSSAWVVV